MPVSPKDMSKPPEVADPQRVEMFCNLIDHWLNMQEKGKGCYDVPIHIIGEDEGKVDLDASVINTYDRPSKLELKAICAAYLKTGWRPVSFECFGDVIEIHLGITTTRNSEDIISQIRGRR